MDEIGEMRDAEILVSTESIKEFALDVAKAAASNPSDFERAPSFE
jgi:hypothetical protein